MNHTKMVEADLDSSQQELFNDGPGIVVALSVFRELIVRVFLLMGVQSSCTYGQVYIVSHVMYLFSQ